MATQNASSKATIEWDDGALYVFSFTGVAGTKQFGGFIHLAVAQQFGQQVQVSATVQQVTQTQLAPDPQTWIETLKNSHRSGASLSITYEDTVNAQVTTVTNQSFQLQQIFSLAG
jgi:glutamine synthetase type III